VVASKHRDEVYSVCTEPREGFEGVVKKPGAILLLSGP
jgi:hypothetical protein